MQLDGRLANSVLTAGHCAVDESTGITDDPAGFAVGTGAVDLNDASALVVSGVSEVIAYPHYNWITATSDAALLVLSHPISAPAVTMPTSADRYLAEETKRADLTQLRELDRRFAFVEPTLRRLDVPVLVARGENGRQVGGRGSRHRIVLRAVRARGRRLFGDAGAVGECS